MTQSMLTTLTKDVEEHDHKNEEHGPNLTLVPNVASMDRALL
jgi:hypothetical protein